ncbi:MAG: DUF4435 domain-containing protein [Muribaculaceae bacterium]|nr:DUF4435 domain-containing protein [Muribaculaceae bacterium]
MSRIEDQANYYKNLHLRDRSIIAVIHIEDEADKEFWNVQLQNVRIGHYYFISHSKNDNGVETKGCEQCLKYRQYTNRQFFICIDSDLRLLCQEDGLTSENYIAQTYAYSWENHLCEAEHLQLRFSQKLKETDFNFVKFLSAFSRIVYKPLLYLVYYQTPELNSLWNIKIFNKCIPLQPSQKDLADNGTLYLQKIKQLFDTTLSSLSLYLPDNFAIEGLTPDNAYLHIQGHQLYNLINHIGTRICKGERVGFKSQILDEKFPTSGYKEIEDVQSDLRTILAT